MPGIARARRLIFALIASLVGALATAPGAFAASQPPAGGADLGQVVIATGGATVATAILLWICMSHRSGRIKWLGRLAAFAEKETGVAGGGSLPGAGVRLSPPAGRVRLFWGIFPPIANRPHPRAPPHPPPHLILPC